MSSRVRKPIESARGTVVELGVARERHRLNRYRDRVTKVLEHNRLAMTRLFESGLLFSRHGARVGQELLRAHQALHRLDDLLSKASREQSAGKLADPREAEGFFEEIDAMLEKTSEIARRHKALFQGTQTPGL